MAQWFFHYFVIIYPWKKENFKIRQFSFVILYNYLPHGKGQSPSVWLKLAQWFWRRRLLKFLNVFSLFRNYLSLKKNGTHHLNKLESTSSKDALCQVWLKLSDRVILGKKCEQFSTMTTTTTTDNGQILIRKASFLWVLRIEYRSAILHQQMSPYEWKIIR